MSIIFGVSLVFNGYWIYRSYKEKKDIKEIVNEKLDPIIDETKDKNYEINKKENDFKTELNNEIKEVSNKSTNSGIYETIYIDDKTYQIELEKDLLKSQEQTKFYISKVNDITAHYTKTISEKDELINELTDKLENVKKDLTTDITNRNIDKELESSRNDFFRFGLDLYFVGGIPISDWIENKKIDTNFNSYSFGLGLNFMLIKKFNVRTSLGIDYRNTTISPEFGVSIGYFF